MPRESTIVAERSKAAFADEVAAILARASAGRTAPTTERAAARPS